VYLKFTNLQAGLTLVFNDEFTVLKIFFFTIKWHLAGINSSCFLNYLHPLVLENKFSLLMLFLINEAQIIER
jgi:hypothetical protein